MSVLNALYFHDETAALAYVESRIWPNGPTCPHCGNADPVKIGQLKGKSTRPGVRKCYECRKPFTVKVGTIFESSHIPLHLWLQAIHLICASKKGISSNQLHRVLGITLKSAWFMSHRIREAMKINGSEPPMGGKGEIIEADETYLGSGGFEFVTGEGWKPKRGVGDRMKIVTLVERGGRARSVKVDEVTVESVTSIVKRNASRHAVLMTDEAKVYGPIGKQMERHYTVNHGKGEYSDGFVSTNTVEGYFSIFKRGMKGVYQHCNERHLERYLAEFDFRYNNRVKLGVDDLQRADNALKGVVGKRLTYKAAGV
jgi:transposase-like protein